MSPPKFPGRTGPVQAEEKGALFDRNRAFSTDYEQGSRWFIPGYDASRLFYCGLWIYGWLASA